MRALTSQLDLPEGHLAVLELQLGLVDGGSGDEVGDRAGAPLFLAAAVAG